MREHEELRWQERQIIDHQYPMIEAEKEAVAQEMADCKIKISQLESELSEIRKNYKERLDTLSGQLMNAALRYKRGLGEVVKVECDIYQDFANEKMVYIRAEDGVEIFRRDMLDSEKMPNLFYLLKNGSKRT